MDASRDSGSNVADTKNKSDSKDKINIEHQVSIEDLSFRYKLKVYRYAISAGLAFLLILIVILALIIPGQPYVDVPLRNIDGRFVEAVTSCGLVEGIREDGAVAFRGIPYALSPLLNNRWKPAHPLNNLSYCWNGTFLAHNATESCSQIHSNGTIAGIEDCLYLDVITPYVRYDTPLPVVVLIGSESMMGGSPEKMRPSTRYARSRDVLFVRPNFRIGVLGFLSSDILSKSVHPPTSGNYGLSDIIEALRWVQMNIEHFGGDPESVTLFGHRTGATLVTALTASKLSKGLFARSWATSGGTIFPEKNLAESEKTNDVFLASTPCKKSMECLWEQDVQSLIEAVPDVWRKSSADLPKPSEATLTNHHDWLVLDGIILKEHPIKFWTNEHNNADAIKLVVGTTAHAGASDLLFMRHTLWTSELIKQYIQDSILGAMNLTSEILSRYEASYQGLVALISDIRVVCPLLDLAARKQGTPFYIVSQTRHEQNIADVDSDIDAIFGRYEPKSPEQRRYVAAIQQLFYHYVWHGEVLQTSPNGNDLLLIEQDVFLAQNYAPCDFLIQKNIVPKFAQID